MNTANLYQLLSIPDYSDIAVVKKAFRQLALKFHPDRNLDPSAAEIFKTLVKAYEILSNSELKYQYDIRLKNGFSAEHGQTASKAPSEKEMQRRRYAKMRRDQDALREVENITSYENSLKILPFRWRVVFIGLLQITGILNILNDWYKEGNRIALGFLLFSLSSLFLWNELYKYFWHKSLTKDEKKYDRQAYSWFISLFLIGIFSAYSLIKIKKIWHLNTFGKVIYAGVNHQMTTLSYTYNDYLYSIDIYSIPPELEDKEQVLIKISTKEPEIWEYFKEE